MTNTTEQPKKTGAETVRWNLNDLYADIGAIDDNLDQADIRAEEFATRYKTRVASLSPAEFVQSVKEMETLQEQLQRIYTYAYLNWSTKTDDADRGALLQKARERCSRTEQKLLFFELECMQLEDEQAEQFLESPALGSYKHYLEFQRTFKNHVLTEPEEKILLEKAVTGRQAWVRLFDETMGAARFRFNEQQLTSQEVLTKLYDGDREIRKRAASSITAGLNQHLRELTFIFNITLAESASQDRLRGFSTWMSSRNLANKVTDEAVRTLVEAVSDRYDLVGRYYRLKRTLLGLSELYDYDRYAPLGNSKTFFSWEQARDLVFRAYQAFHPTFGSIADDFFNRGWIDAALQAGKMSGAFSHPGVPSVHPYVLMNYGGTPRDVQTLAHELGHGIHQHLSRKQGVLLSGTPLTMAETASVFGEMLVFDQLIKSENDRSTRLSMLVTKIDDTMATVFRQVAMTRFEHRIHEARRNGGELSPDDFSELWLETQNEMFQGNVHLGDHYGIWWSYIQHFVHAPGYVYAYAFGELMVLALYAKYKEEKSVFAENYLGLLEAGGSDWPEALLDPVGIDLSDSGFWQSGLLGVEALIAQAEDLAQQLGETETPE